MRSIFFYLEDDRMPTSRSLRTIARLAALMATASLLTACQQQGQPRAHKDKFPHEDGDPIVRADTFPFGQADRFDQPYPMQPLFGKTDYLRERQVWPVALADIREPLPAAVPLPARVANVDVIQPTAETAQASEDQGGSSPASGMAQGITNAQGGGETNQHDGGKTDVPRE